MKTCLLPFRNENMSIELKIESMIKQNSGTGPMISVRCKKMIMINEHISKHQAKDNQLKGCAKPRERDESPREKAC